MVTPELYPTEMRATGHAACAAVSKIFSFCAPYLVLSNKVSLMSIGFILGVMNLVAAIAAQMLPVAGGNILSSFRLALTNFSSLFILGRRRVDGK